MIKNPFAKLPGKFFSQLKFTVPIIIILAGVLLVITLSVTNPSIFDLKGLKSTFSNLAISYNLTKFSLGKVYLDKKLNIEFKIEEKDRQAFNEFSKNLGVDPEAFNKLSLDINPESRQRLENLLPWDLRLNIGPKSLKFSNNEVMNPLKSGLVKSEYNFATGSARLNYKSLGGNDFVLDLNEPEDLVKYATESGQLHLSSKLDGLFPIMEKVSRINLRVEGKQVNGEIDLR